MNLAQLLNKAIIAEPGEVVENNPSLKVDKDDLTKVSELFASGDKDKQNAFLQKVADRITELSAENSALKDRLSKIDLEKRAQAMAGNLAQKGYIDRDEINNKAEELIKTCENFDELEKAINVIEKQSTQFGKVAELKGSASDPYSKLIANIIKG